MNESNTKFYYSRVAKSLKEFFQDRQNNIAEVMVALLYSVIPVLVLTITVKNQIFISSLSVPLTLSMLLLMLLMTLAMLLIMI